MEITELSGMEMSEVERGTEGLPKAWPIFRAGDNIVTRSNAMPVNLKLTGEDLRSIADYQKAKGTKIPIDCQHVVSNLAGKLGIDETDLLKQMPRFAGVAGFGNLEARGDALYLSDVTWLPIGAEVMKAGQFRYFSPSIRGLDGKSPLRVMSVALTNNPCLQRPADLAASEDEDDVTPEKVRAALEHITKSKEAAMAEEEMKTDTAPAASAPPEPEKKNDGELLAVLKEVLGDDVTPENLKVTLASLKTKADATEELSEKVKQLAELNYTMQNPGRTALDTIGGAEIKTNSLTARGGFAGGAVAPDKDRINRAIEGYNKRMAAQLEAANRLLGEIKTGLTG